jgi:cysteine synthase A
MRILVAATVGLYCKRVDAIEHLLWHAMSSRRWSGLVDWFREWNRPKVKLTRDLFLGLLLGFTFSLSSASLALYWQQRRRRKAVTRTVPRPIQLRSDEVVHGVVGLIGNTPLVRINSLSDALGVEILVSWLASSSLSFYHTDNS